MKITFAFMLLICLLSLCACGGGEGAGTASTPDFSEASALSTAEVEPQRVEKRFQLENGQFKLNAVHSFINDGNPHPTVLLIAGSGPADCDETLGSLKPFAHIAENLLDSGICTLRLDKRTLNYGAAMAHCGIGEEYLQDISVALDYLKAQPATGEIFLLGHSLGGQIATIIDSERSDIAGIIQFNSSLRHLADICLDQLAKADPANADAYRQYASLAKAATAENAKGLYYYGADDHYWASYNSFNIAEMAKNSKTPMLIINSTADIQSFDSDIKLWQELLGGSEAAAIITDNKISHLGYELDLSDPASLTSDAEFPKRITDTFAEFVLSHCS